MHQHIVAIPWFLLQTCALNTPHCEMPIMVWQRNEAVCEELRAITDKPQDWTCTIDIPAWMAMRVYRGMQE